MDVNLQISFLLKRGYFAVDNNFVLNSLFALFKIEIQNQITMCKDGMIVTLGNGTKAIIKTKNVA